MKQFPWSIDFHICATDDTIAHVRAIPPSAATIAGFLLKPTEDETTGCETFLMQTTNVTLQPEINEDLAALRQVDAGVVDMTMAFGSFPTENTLWISLVFGQTIKSEILKQLESLMMAFFIALDGLQEQGINIIINIGWNRGDGSHPSNFTSAKKELLELFDPDIPNRY